MSRPVIITDDSLVYDPAADRSRDANQERQNSQGDGTFPAHGDV